MHFTKAAFAAALLSLCHGAATPAPPPAINPEYVKALMAAQSQTSKTNTHIKNMMLVQDGSPQAVGVNRTAWTPAADSHQLYHSGYNTLDNNVTTYWESEVSPVDVPLPHQIVIDMKQSYYVSGIVYLPRQDGSSNGNIGQHVIQLSADGKNWGVAKAIGTFIDNSEVKMVNFSTTAARYFRITAMTEAGNRGPYTSAADLTIYSVPSYNPPPSSQGSWGLTIDFPIVPVAVAVLHGSGRLLAWSAYQADQFNGGAGSGVTFTALYDPASRTVSERFVTNIGHDMFCPGLSLDSQGRPIVTGGSDSLPTSEYDPVANTWTALAQMNLGRGYQGQTTLSNGEIFTIGGSFSGPLGGKNGEIYNPSTNTWTLLNGCLVAPMLTNDGEGVYRSDNHAWLFAWRNQSVFQAGPSKAMNWYGTSTPGGTQTGAGLRGNDNDAMNGNAVMYDAVAGSILAVGGAPDYDSSEATTNANIITIGTPNTPAAVVQIGPMSYARTFANSIVLPNGQVLVVGGQSYSEIFTDNNAIMIPELWDPITHQFTPMAPLASPRTYHSVGVLLPDATVFSGGGGLCGDCTANHFDGQIFNPPYLLNPDGSAATRPTISSVSSTSFAPGTTLTVVTGSAVASFSLLRYGSATHALNTDQRRIPLTPLPAGTNTYTIVVPSDPGIVLPGSWMLFALNAAGTPSIATTVLITVPS